MKIVDITVQPFTTWADRFAHASAQPQTEITQTLTTIHTDDGAVGYYFGGHGHGDQDGLRPESRAELRDRIRPMLVGLDPWDRELIWQRLWGAKVAEHLIGVVDLALWDLAGRAASVPVYKLLGGCRDRVPAYASTYPNLGSPQDYAAHAVHCREAGYRAYKIHPYYYWDPATRAPAPARPSHLEYDIAACRAVREAVGDTMTLMYDPWGTYHTFADALRIGRELERLNFYWYEHPMPEERIEPYVRLCEALEIPICSPEILPGHVFTRAEWIRRGASDISRLDVLRGGITAVRKTLALCEAYGVRCEVHMSGIGNLHTVGSTHPDVSEYYERGLLAPGVDYDAPAPYLRQPLDVLDPDGFVTLPTNPGLGYVVDWDYIAEHRLE